MTYIEKQALKRKKHLDEYKKKNSKPLSKYSKLKEEKEKLLNSDVTLEDKQKFKTYFRTVVFPSLNLTQKEVLFTQSDNLNIDNFIENNFIKSELYDNYTKYQRSNLYRDYIQNINFDIIQFITKKDILNEKSIFYSDLMYFSSLIKINIIEEILQLSYANRKEYNIDLSINTKRIISKHINLKLNYNNKYYFELKRRIETLLKVEIRKLLIDSFYNYEEWNTLMAIELLNDKLYLYKKLITVFKDMIKQKKSQLTLDKEEKQVDKQNKLVHSLIKNQNADNVFYYLKIIYKNTPYYKIGITRHSVVERYSSYTNNDYTILYEERVDGAIRFEEMLKEKFKKDLFHLALLGTKGTEIFDRDILELDIH